eukprot:1138667-Pelagomonas_calceolata.AAC.1
MVWRVTGAEASKDGDRCHGAAALRPQANSCAGGFHTSIVEEHLTSTGWMCLCAGRSCLGCRTSEAGKVAVAGAECFLLPPRPPLFLNGHRESVLGTLFIGTTNIASGRQEVRRVIFIECSGICKFCRARQSALSMSMEARPVPRELVITFKKDPVSNVVRSVTI